MVIYLAAITGISDEYYEAARIDGAEYFSADLVHYSTDAEANLCHPAVVLARQHYEGAV